MSQLKICTRCREKKPRSAFEKTRTSPDGLGYYCRLCTAARRREAYPRRRAALLARCKEYFATPSGRATRKAYWKKYYAAHIEELRADGRMRAKRDAAQRLATTRIWRAKNKDRVKAYKKNHEAPKRAGRRGAVSARAWKIIQSTFRNRCVYCGAEANLEQDHVKALSKGGEHLPHNVVPACRHCNATKHAGDPPPFWWVKSA